MYKARKYLNKSTLKNLYHAYICPYLTYCVEVWCCASKCHLNSLFLLQKNTLRIMTFSPYLAHTDLLFKSFEILPMDTIFIDKIGITMFKVTDELIPKSIHQLFSKNKEIHSHNTRNINLLRVSTGTKNFTFLSSRIRNAIVCNININVTLSQFKYILKLSIIRKNLTYYIIHLTLLTPNKLNNLYLLIYFTAMTIFTCIMRFKL